MARESRSASGNSSSGNLSSVFSFGGRPNLFLSGLLLAAVGLLWVAPSQVSSVRNGVSQVLEPGRKAVKWFSVRAYLYYQKTAPSTQQTADFSQDNFAR